MVTVKSDEDIKWMRHSGTITAAVLAELAKNAHEGISLNDLDRIAESMIKKMGAVPAFKNYRGYPKTITVSIDEQVVHGIPNDVPLQDGDIVSIDCGTKLNGFCGDSCYTFSVGEVSDDIRDLLRITKEALYKGIEQAVVGHRLGDISSAIQSHCENHGYGVVREFVGHGIGKEMHEDPQVPNFGKRGNGILLKNGLCIAIEPMITLGSKEVYMQSDKWGIVTRDSKVAAHFEHTICVRKGQADILSSFKEIEEIIKEESF